MVPDMCSDAGLVGKKTNHSLRVSGATSLFEAGVPERVIQKRTGHRSLQSLRMYERVSDGQEKAVSRILTGEKKNYSESLMESTTSSKVTCNESSSAIQSPIPSSKSSGIQCNNCTVNVYSSPQIPSVNFHSMANFSSMPTCYPPFPYYNPYYQLPFPSSPYPNDGEEHQ